jgi:hypothetical protein
VQLGQDVTDAVPHGLRGQDETPRDGRVVVTASQELEHLPFARGELREGHRGADGLSAGREERHHVLGDTGTEHGLAPSHGEHGPMEVVRARLLEQVAVRAHAQGGEHRVGVLVHGQHEDAGVGVSGADARSGLETVHAGHAEVHQDDVGDVLAHGSERLLTVAGHGHDGDVVEVVEHGPHTREEHRVVVDDEY